MKISFDHQTFTLQSYGGISRYFSKLAGGLLSLGDQVNILAPIHQNRYLDEISSRHIHGIGVKSIPPRAMGIISAFNGKLGALQAGLIRPEILHETYYTSRPVVGRFKGRVLTVYDMIHEKFERDFHPSDQTSQLKRIAVARADHIICISHSTKKDLCEIFGVDDHKVSVVHLGFENFKSLESDIPVDLIPSPFLLYVGSRGGYKNFSGLLRAVASLPELRDNFDVLAFGGGQFSAEERVLIKSLGLREKSVRQIGGSDQILSAIYGLASAFVYPSLYEGFGLPPLEAMAHDCPVVSSNASSMPEVVGPAGEYFAPNDIEAQAAAIKNVVFDSENRGRLIEEGRVRAKLFSWTLCTQKTREIYASVLHAGAHG